MKNYFGYIRVSTAKQGEHGVSLQEQRDAIDRYCQRNALEIIEWFEERETAAKRGRPVFGRMLELLKKGKAHGVIVHKIDRSARNLKDWAELGELIDKGIEVHFVNESLDLKSRGGRLSADIQAVVAADFIRNLREETRKGFYGRLKQGFYPLPAPLGYLDTGKAKPKVVDQATAPLVRQAFELYATAQFNLETLNEELYRRGLRSRKGRKVSRNGLSILLNNPFYLGLIRLRKTGETFPGTHEPLIRKTLFDRVQEVLNGKVSTRTQRHNFLFRRLLTCKHCGYSLIGEKQKGYEYYRCHTKNCPATCIRQEIVEQNILNVIKPVQFSDYEKTYLEQKVSRLKENWNQNQDAEINALNLRLSQLQDRLVRLTDAYIDRLIEKEIFEERKAALLMERKDLEERLTGMNDTNRSVPNLLAEFIELAGSVYLSYEMGFPDEKRDLLKIVTSNREVDRKYVDIRLSLPFSEVAKCHQFSNGDPYRDRPRTLDKMIDKLVDWFEKNPQSLGKSVQAPSY
jgi:site-specific DNA recombinase